MLFSWRRRAPHVIVDLGSASVKLAVTGPEPRSPSLLHPTALPLPPKSIRSGWIVDGTAVAEAIASFVRRGRLRGAAAVASVPGRTVMLKVLHLPIQDERELDRAVELEALRAIPEKRGNVLLDYQLLGDSSDGRSPAILLAAAKKELVRSYMEVLSRAGLTPSVIDVDYLALHNLCRHLHPDGNNRVVGVMHAGASGTTLSMIGGDGDFLFSSELEIGGRIFTRTLSNAAGISAQEAEVLKIGDRACDFTAMLRPLCDDFTRDVEAELKRFAAITGRAVDRLFTCGGAMNLPVLQEALFDNFKGWSGRIEPVFGGTQAERADVPAPEFAVAAGLALRCS